MTALADRLDRARRLAQEANEELRVVSHLAPEVRSEVQAEYAVLQRSVDRIGGLRAKLLAAGWSRFLKGRSIHD